MALGAALIAVMGLPIVPERAAAEPITLPYVDRLGCGTDDASVTPVFGWAGSGTAANGAGYTATTDASAYPATTGSFSGVAGGPAYTTFSPAGYGSDFQYRGTGALGFSPVNPGQAATLTMQLPHPQAMQFTVGGIQLPSRMQISGRGPSGVVTPTVAARDTTPGSATAATIGSSVQITGAVNDGSADGIPRNSVDVWFASPVSSITLSLSTTGGSQDAGFLVTAPIACQSGTTSTTATVGAATVDAPNGRVSHDVALVTTVQNSSPASGATLHPAVSAPLRAALEAQGMSLDAVTAGAASDPACTASAGLDGSGPLIAPGAQGLVPGGSCTLDWTATVSMPQSAADRTVDLASALRSSAGASSRVKSQATTPITFPGLVSDLAITDSGATQGQPGQAVARTATITNNGEGTALATTYTLTAPSGATLSGLPAECTTDGSTATCDLGNIAPGAARTIGYTVTLAASAAPGSTLTLDAQASSSAQPAPASFSYGIRVVAPPVVPPPPAPRPDPPARPAPPVPRPSPSPSPTTPTSTPTPTPTPAPVVKPPPAPGPEPEPEPEPEPANRPFPMALSFAGSEIVPGTVSTLRGTLGPAGDEAVEITLSGRVNQGMAYRLVRILIDGEEAGSCVTQTREFTCTVTLQPGEQAEIEVRLFADSLNAPDRAIQQISLNTGDGTGDNSSTVSTAIASDDRDTDDWVSAFTLDMSTLDGAFLPLTAMLLLALAATAAERRRP